MEQQILWCFPRVWRADISVLSQVRILYVNEKEKRYKRNIMFLFAGHFDKPLKSLISIAHKENNICLYRFSFIYAVNDLWEDAYTCPINVMDCTTKFANEIRKIIIYALLATLSKVLRNPALPFLLSVRRCSLWYWHQNVLTVLLRISTASGVIKR